MDGADAESCSAAVETQGLQGGYSLRTTERVLSKSRPDRCLYIIVKLVYL